MNLNFDLRFTAVFRLMTWIRADSLSKKWQLCARKFLNGVTAYECNMSSSHNLTGKEMRSKRRMYLTCIACEQIQEKVEESQLKYLLSIFSRLRTIISNSSSENLNCVRLLISVMSGFASSTRVNSFKSICLSASQSG